MLTASRRLLLIGLTSALASCASKRANQHAGQYVCPPCGCAADGAVFAAPGKCPACGMTLVPKPAQLGFEPKTIVAGAGVFAAAGGRGHEEKRIGVHYYKPSGFTAASPILLVIPGSGRNGDSYRDAWIDTAEQYNILVAALEYPEADYDFAAYQMGGVIKDLQIRNAPVGADGALPDSLHLRDEDISFAFNDRNDEWLFGDFDRIFHLLAAAAGSSRTRYDLFGHSAGGQILHRLALFHPRSRAHRIVAANAGFYTLPLLDTPLLFGLGGAGVSAAALSDTFACDLTLLLGELDNDPERGGQHLHTPIADRQGLDRLSRGKYFFQRAEEQARALGVPFRWKLSTVPGVGHDQAGMARAAARYLYG